MSMLAPHLTVENHATLLASAKHKSKREVEQLVAAVRPQPSVPSTIRKLPSQAATLPAANTPNPPLDQHQTTEARPLDGLPIPTPAFQPQRIAEVKPLAPERYKVQFTASQETYDKLRLAQDLLRHAIPSGDVAAVIDRALTLLVEELQRTKYAAVDRPRAARPSTTGSSNRYIPAAVRREVWRRDGGQCAFVGVAGRCAERGLLEYHHRVPFADGGAATVGNLELRCRAHNAYEAERWFGSDLVREARSAFSAGARNRDVAACSSSQRRRPSSAAGNEGRALGLDRARTDRRPMFLSTYSAPNRPARRQTTESYWVTSVIVSQPVW